MPPETDALGAGRFRRIMARGCLALSLLCAVWVLWLTRTAMSGAFDMYPNQHWRLIANATTSCMIFLGVGPNIV